MKNKIALDAFGGDNAPAAAIKGAVLALEEVKRTIILVGDREKIEKELKNYTYDKSRIEIVDAKEVIGTDEVPTQAIRRKKDSSMMVGLNLLKEEKAGAFISAGNTGALLAGATLRVGRMEGVLRPVLGAAIPNAIGYTLIVDSGANVDAEPAFLEQFAILGSIYMKEMMNIEAPKVGLLNVGVEAEKEIC